MTDEMNLVPLKASGKFNMGLLAKVKGLAENSQLRHLQGSGQLRLTVDGNQFQIKKGSKVLQILKDGKKPLRELMVVIHSISPVIQQQLAAKWDPKDPKFEPLGCWSNNGNEPDEDCWNPMSSKCDTCKHGGNGDMQCSLTRLAVVSIVSQNVPEEPMLMNFNWSSNSTKKPGEDMDENHYCLINYLRMLADNEVETFRIKTNLIIDDYSDSKNNCKLLFQPVDIVRDDDPNFIAHKAWSESSKYDLDEMIKIKQSKPQATAGAEAGAPEPEPEPEQKSTKAADAKAAKAKAAKAEAAKKREEAAAAKIKAAKAAEEIEDLDDLDSFEDDEDVVDEEDTLEEESEDDYGDLDDLLS